MSDFDKLEHEGEDLAQQHPQQVKEGEDAAEKKLGFGQQDGGQQNQDDGQQNNAQQNNAQQGDGQQGDSQPDGAGDSQN